VPIATPSRIKGTQSIAIGRQTLVGRTALEGHTIHIPDVLADPEYTWTESIKRGGWRTLLGVPLLREGISMPIGVIALQRNTMRPFTDKQIELVTTFADQAVNRERERALVRRGAGANA
jgi:signal transduction protein with GAF and PtsI domain